MYGGNSIAAQAEKKKHEDGVLFATALVTGRRGAFPKGKKGTGGNGYCIWQFAGRPQRQKKKTESVLLIKPPEGDRQLTREI